MPTAFYADTCDYNRSFPTGWVTTYLPYNWTLPDGCKAYQASSDLLTTDTDGRYVGTDFTRLPDGIYIKKGKKFVVKRH